MATTKTAAPAKPDAVSKPVEAQGTPGTAVAAPRQAPVQQYVPADVAATLMAQAGAGMENAQAKDFALPFLALAQSLSPQVDKQDERYIEGLEPGMLFNTVTGEFWNIRQKDGEPLPIIPCHFQSAVIEWVKQDEGGGFVASYPNREVAALNQRQDVIQQGQNKGQLVTQLVDTANHFVLVPSNRLGGLIQGILSCTSTKLRFSRRLMTRIGERAVGGKTLPSYAGRYGVQSILEEKNGKKYYTYSLFTFDGAAGWIQDMATLEQARHFYEQVAAGAKGADFNAMQETVVEGVVEEAGPRM